MQVFFQILSIGHRHSAKASAFAGIISIIPAAPLVTCRSLPLREIRRSDCGVGRMARDPPGTGVRIKTWTDLCVKAETSSILNRADRPQ